MTDRYDVVQFRKTSTGKTFAVRLGSAKRNDDGGFRLYLDALPIPDGGNCTISVVPPRERGQAPAGNVDIGDAVPF